MKKPTSSMILLGFLALIAGACQQAEAIDANALPNAVGATNVTNEITGNTLTSTVRGAAGTVGQSDYTGGLGSAGTWNINASAHSQTFLGRFVDGNLTELNGKINTGCAAGLNCSYGDTLKVILTNPYGITFGNGSQVNANSFTVSTFDPVGAKNIQGLSPAELQAYTQSIQSKFGYNVPINFQGGATTDGAVVTLNNSNWNIDKSAAIIAKDVNIYNGSKISTNLEPNYGGGTKNFSNVKIVTSDGVNFTYKANGYLDNASAEVKEGKANVDYSIKIGDKNSAKDVDATIESGSVYIAGGSEQNTNNSSIKISKAAIKGYKLVNSAQGDIYLVGNDVEVNDSTLATENYTNNTIARTGGQISIVGKNKVDLNNTKISTASSTSASTDPKGDVIVETSNGDINAKGTTIDSNGNITLVAKGGNTNVNNTKLNANQNDKDVTIYGGKNVDIQSASVKASKDVTIQSKNNTNIKSTDIVANKNLNITGKNTLIQDSALSYNNIALHDGTNNNNVTIKGKSTFQDKGHTNLTLNVKGNLTADNATLKTKTPGSTVAAENQTNITLNATGDVTIKNKSDITSKNNMNVKAGDDVNVYDSKVVAGAKNDFAAAANINLDKAYVDADTVNSLVAENDVNIECSTVDGGSNKITAKEGNNGISNTNIISYSSNDITAQKNIKTSNTRITAKTNTNIKSNTGNISIINTDIQSKGKNTVQADEGNVDFYYDQALSSACANGTCVDVVTKTNVKGTANDVIAQAGDISIKGTDVTATDGDNNIHTPTGETLINNSKITAKGDNNITANDGVGIECATLDAENNNIESEYYVDIAKSLVKAKADNSVTAKNNVNTTSVELNAKNNTLVSKENFINAINTKLVATEKNTVNAKTRDVIFQYDENLAANCVGENCLAVDENLVKGANNDIIADKGNIDIQKTPIIATEGDNNIKTPTGSIKLKDVEVKADKGDNNVVAYNDVDTECATLDAENNNVVATTGKVDMKTTLAKAKTDNKVTAKGNVSTTSVELNAKNNTVTSKSGSINAVNTKLDATGKNKVAATNGNVSFTYDEDVTAQCIGTGCPTVDESTIKGPDNEIIGGDDVIIDGGIKPDDPTKPEDTKTTITAGGDVKTGAKVVYNNLKDQKGHIVGKGELDTNGTQLKVNTPGNINLVLKNTNNPKAGLDLNGKKVEIKTREAEAGNNADPTLSISKIYANDLYLSKDEKFVAGETTITPAEKAIDSFSVKNPASLATQEGFDNELPGRGYIEVEHGFNFDYEPSEVAVGGMYQGSFNQVTDADGNIIGYKKHYITLDENTTQGEFLLTYAKPFAAECDPEPIVEPDDAPVAPTYITDQTALTRIPLQIDTEGNSNAISNGVTDPSISMIAAAAAVDVDEDEQLDY